MLKLKFLSSPRPGALFSPLRERLARLALALAAMVLFLLIAPATATAQTRPPPPPSVLTAVTATESGPGEVRLLLTFAPLAPKWSIIRDNTDKPAIAFALSSRGDGARTPPASALHGILKSVGFEQHETILILTTEAAGAAHLEARAVGEREIALTISPPGPKRTAVEEGPAATTGPLPRAADLGGDDDGFEVVPLKYADVSEVVGLLTAGLTVKSNDNFIPHEPAFGSAGMNGSSSFSAIQPTPDEMRNQPLGQSVDEAIGIDRRLNAIVLRGPRARIEKLKARIAEIDVPVESVVLETIFVELTESGAKNVGLDFNNTNNQLAVATFQTGAYVPVGSGYGKSQLGSAALQAAIYAQVQQGHGRIVSKPRIAAQSGGTAKIITGDALPILTAITLSGVNGVSQQVQYVNVGVTLQIAPRVSSDGYVTSHVFCVVSSVTGFSQGYPTISQREASTSATVHDGETFVIGGLTQENEITANEKVPGVGDIPVVGRLFGLKKGTGSKTELYIVVTPRIVRRGEKPPPDVLPGAN